MPAIGYRHTQEAKNKIGIAGLGNTYALGHKHTLATRAKMSFSKMGNKNSLGRVHPPCIRAKISAALRGKKRPPRSPEHRAKLRAARLGQVHSLETREKMSVAHVGRRPSPETRARMSAAQIGRSSGKGRVVSLNTRAKISAALTGRICGPMPLEQRLRIGAALVGHVHSLESRAKMSAAKKGRIMNPLSPETRAKISLANKGRKRGSLSVEHRHKIGAANSLAILEGRRHPESYSRSGWFDSEKNARRYHYRSSWELEWYEYLEFDNKTRAFWVEPFAIPYYFDGLVRLYHPDILVEYMDGSLELMEVRPERKRNFPKELAKFAAGREWCSKHEHCVFRVVGRVGKESVGGGNVHVCKYA